MVNGAKSDPGLSSVILPLIQGRWSCRTWLDCLLFPRLTVRPLPLDEVGSSAREESQVSHNHMWSRHSWLDQHLRANARNQSRGKELPIRAAALSQYDMIVTLVLLEIVSARCRLLTQEDNWEMWSARQHAEGLNVYVDGAPQYLASGLVSSFPHQLEAGNDAEQLVYSITYGQACRQ